MIDLNSREKSMEQLTEHLIKMLGKSNEKIIELSKRVSQLELIVLQSVQLNAPKKRPYTVITTSNQPAAQEIHRHSSIHIHQ